MRAGLSRVTLILRDLFEAPAFKILFAAAAFLAALAWLRHELSGSSLSAVAAAATATAPSALALAGLATLASYACLVVSEWWALRVIGRALSLRRIGVVTVVSYALSNALGFSVATGGAARLRFYHAWGLTTAQAAAVTVLAGLAVTVSGLVGAGAALLFAPGLSAPYLALAVLLLTPSGLWFVRPPSRVWFLPGVELSRPSYRQGLLALGGGVLDWVFSGLALFVLLPGATAADFPAFLAIFVLGSVVSALSGVPGGIGVFDVVVLALSRQVFVVHETAAALIIYRLIYAIGPLLLTAIGVCVDQVRRLLRRARAADLLDGVDSLAPLILAVLTFYVGATLLLAAANAPVHLASPIALAVEPPRSALLSGVTGALLVVLGSALWRRQEGAYYAAMALLLCGAAGELLGGFGWLSAGALLAVAALLAPCRSAFARRSFLLRDWASPAWTMGVALSGVAAWMLALIDARPLEARTKPWWALVVETGRSGALSLSAVLAAIALVVLAAWLLGPARRADLRPTRDEIGMARKIIQSAGAVTCDAFLSLMGDKAFVFSPSRQSFVMFKARGEHWIAMGDPVGPSQDRPAAIAAFIAAAEASGAKPAFYAVEEASLPDLVAAGFSPIKIGESALVDAAGFDLKGGGKDDLRQARNRAERLGLTFRVYPADDPATPWRDLERVSTAWLAVHAGAEKSFSLGAFDIDYLRNFPMAVLSDQAGVLAFGNVLAAPDRSRFGIDLMRSRPDGPHGAMDAFFVDLIFWGQALGYRRFELGMAPLAGLDAIGVESWSRRIERLIYHVGETTYGFAGLRAYKEKFAPDWRPMFLAAPPGLPPLAVLADVAVLTSGGVRGAFLGPMASRPHAAAAASRAEA